MILLAFDTSSRDASFALLRDDEIVMEYNFSSRDDLSAMMMPSLEFLLRSLGLKLAQIDLFAAAVGPGLFTGIRIGLATLKGLNLAAGKPMVGVNTLEALACKLADSRHTIVPMIDARKGEIYAAAYACAAQPAGGPMVERLRPCLLKVEDAAAVLADFPDKAFIGSGAEIHRDRLRRDFPADRLLVRSNFLASEIGRLALAAFQRGQFSTDPQDLRPVYIRRPDAETRRSRRSSVAD